MLAPATPPAAPTSPKPKRNVAIAIVLGLLLGIGLAFLREYFDDTVGSREDLERATNGLPVLGEVPRIPGWHDRQESHLVIAESPNSYTAESYRTLRTSIEFLAFDRELKSIQLTSSQADDGKTTTLANLSLAFARSGIQVTIVCCDLRRPRVHEFFGLRNEVGFTSVLLGRSAVLDALQQVEGEPNHGSHLGTTAAEPVGVAVVAPGRRHDLVDRDQLGHGPAVRRQPARPSGRRRAHRERHGRRDAARREPGLFISPGPAANGADAPPGQCAAHGDGAQRRRHQRPRHGVRIRIHHAQLEWLERRGNPPATPQGEPYGSVVGRTAWTSHVLRIYARQTLPLFVAVRGLGPRYPLTEGC